MKNLMAKLKGAGYKDFFLRHGEKVGMGVTALIALICLSITNWKGYADTPEQMKDKAQTVETQLRGNVWPATKKAEFVPVTAEIAVAALSAPVNLSSFMHSVNMSPKLYTYRQPADEPVVLTATELQVSSGQMPLDVMVNPDDEFDESAEEDGPIRGGLAGGAKDRPGARTGDRDRPGARAGDRLGNQDRLGDNKGAGKGGNKGAGAAGDRLGGRGAAGKAGGRMGAMAMGIDDPAGMMMGMGTGNVGTFTGKARGVRYNVITGIVDRRKQLELLKNALHLESPGDVPEYLEYVDFKIQRQRAVPGPKPWSDDPASWKDLDTKNSIDLLLNEAADFDPDLVAPEYINDAITSPLPHRLDGDWDFAEVGHPRLPMLDPEGREIETVKTLISAQIAAEAEAQDDETRSLRGFRRAQKDPTQLRQQAFGVDGGARMNEMMGRIMPGMMGAADGTDDPGFGTRGKKAAAPSRGATPRATIMPGLDSGPTARRGMAGAPGAARGRMGAMPGMDVAGMDSYGAGNIGAATAADTILFRYFDFDIEPGECYRYRVQIVISNPSEDQEFVSSPEVAVGIDRTSKWSDPSPAVAVPKDVEYSLVRIYRRSGRREGAVLSVVQFDTDVGTLIADNLPLRYGEYVGGTKKTEHLNLAVPSFQSEDVNFTSKEILIDSASAPPLSGAALQDLKLNPRQAQKLGEGGGLDHAITLNRFGELVPLDADTDPQYEAARKRYNAQKEAYADLKDESTADAALDKLNSRDMLGSLFGKDGQSRGKKGGGLNPLKMPGGGSGMGMPGPGMSGGLGDMQGTGRGSRGGGKGRGR